MSRLYPVECVRRAEATLLAAQSEPDQLMREAARHVAATATAMLERCEHAPKARVLLLVGTGGNGGDALYAGALLLGRGVRVEALALGERTHEGATRAFREAGGTFLTREPKEWPWAYHLVIDGIVGLGGRAGLGLDTGPSAATPPWVQAREVARELGAVVVLKGRFTCVARHDVTIIIDAGHSWSATPGSGDVLSGLLGAWLARMPESTHEAAVIAVHLHAVAARIAAETPDGPAPTSASRIAEAISRATARELRAYRAARGPW